MIPQIHITEWIKHAPWPSLWQVEQDLIITTALLKIYAHPELQKSLAFRGGTALNKLFFKPSLRYSEDIDLVQINAGPIGPTISILRQVLEGWLGKCKLEQNAINTTLIFKNIISEDAVPLRLKVEVHTREHFTILGYQELELVSSSKYYSGQAIITTYKLEELLGTKIRCLYQRKKGRDLYDLYMALVLFPDLNTDYIISSFKQYIHRSEIKISKSEFLNLMKEKLADNKFLIDMNPLLAIDRQPFNPQIAYEYLLQKLFHKL